MINNVNVQDLLVFHSLERIEWVLTNKYFIRSSVSTENRNRVTVSNDLFKFCGVVQVFEPLPCVKFWDYKSRNASSRYLIGNLNTQP